MRTAEAESVRLPVSVQVSDREKDREKDTDTVGTVPVGVRVALESVRDLENYKKEKAVEAWSSYHQKKELPNSMVPKVVETGQPI